jgi:hypothetical protein
MVSVVAVSSAYAAIPPIDISIDADRIPARIILLFFIIFTSSIRLSVSARFCFLLVTTL